MKTARRHADVVGHRAVCAVTKPRPLRTQVVFARTAIQTLTANCGRRFGNNAVSFSKSLNAIAYLCDRATELMAQNDRYTHWPTLRVMVLMNIAAADANRTDS